MIGSSHDLVVNVLMCVNILGALKKKKENLKNLKWKRKIKVKKNKQKTEKKIKIIKTKKIKFFGEKIPPKT